MAPLLCAHRRPQAVQFASQWRQAAVQVAGTHLPFVEILCRAFGRMSFFVGFPSYLLPLLDKRVMFCIVTVSLGGCGSVVSK